MSAESERVAGFGHLEDGLRQAGEWYQWGPYVSERQWGTVRGPGRSWPRPPTRMPGQPSCKSGIRSEANWS